MVAREKNDRTATGMTESTIYNIHVGKEGPIIMYPSMIVTKARLTSRCGESLAEKQLTCGICDSQIVPK